MSLKLYDNNSLLLGRSGLKLFKSSVLVDATPTKKFEFDGVDDEIDFGGTSLDFDGSESFSLFARIEMTADPSPLHSNIFSKRGVAGGAVGWEFAVVTGELFFILVDKNPTDNGRILIYATTTLSQGVQYSVGFTYTGSGNAAGCKFYVNGVFDATLTVADDDFVGDASDTSVSLALGSRPIDTGGEFPGYIWNAAEYNSVLSASEMLAMHNGGSEIDLLTLSPQPNELFTFSNPGDDATATTGTIINTGTTAGFTGTPLNTSGTNIVDI